MIMAFGDAKKFLMEAEYTDSQFRELKAITEIRLGNFSAAESSSKETKEPLELMPAYTQAFYDQLRGYLKDQCMIATPPLNVLRVRSPKVYTNVVQCANTLYAVAESWNTSKTMRRNYVTGVYHLYAKLVVEYLKSAKVPVSATTAVQHSDKFEGLVDLAYPGYTEGKMMDVVILGPGRPGEILYPPQA